MGYSIGIFAQSKKLQTKMLDFMEKEYRPHWKIRGREEEHCYTSPPRSDLDYFHGSNVIGIDYGPVGGFERGYAYTVVRWMALQVGTKRRTFMEPRYSFKEPVPAMIYDEDPPWPVLRQPLSSVSKELRGCCVDRYGIKLDRLQADDYMFELKEPNAFLKAIRQAHEKFGIQSGQEVNDKNRHLFSKARDEASRILWPQIKEVLAPMRAEMKRLDQAWQSFCK